MSWSHKATCWSWRNQKRSLIWIWCVMNVCGHVLLFFPRTIQGLEDVAKYPLLLAEILADPRWTAEDLKKLVGQNFLRVFEKVELVSLFLLVLHLHPFSFSLSLSRSLSLSFSFFLSFSLFLSSFISVFVYGFHCFPCLPLPPTLSLSLHLHLSLFLSPMQRLTFFDEFSSTLLPIDFISTFGACFRTSWSSWWKNWT